MPPRNERLMLVALKDVPVQQNINSDQSTEFFSSPTTIEHILASIPKDYVQKALTETNKHSRKERLLPSLAMMHFPILLGLFMPLAYGEVFKNLRNAYEWFGLEPPEKFPTEGAMCKARQRLGYEPLEALFKHVVSKQVLPESPNAYYNNLLITAIDGCVFDVEDSQTNAIFGYPQNQNGAGAYPQVSCVALVNLYTRSLMDVEFGTAAGTGEQTIARGILNRLKAGTLNLADRLYPSYEAWRVASTTGAHLLWRVKSDFRLDAIEELKDGSYLARLYKYDENRKRIVDESIIVRVVEYNLMIKKDKKRAKKSKETYRLITTLLDPEQAPAEELATLYPLRYFTSEGFNKEIKTILRAPRIVLRSKSPAMVIQELYGLFLAQHAVRLFMEASAEKADVEPTELSFKHAVNVIRRHLTQAFSPAEVFIIRHT
jgi:hypothetical protein